AYSIEDLQGQIERWIREVSRQGSSRLASAKAAIAKLPAEVPSSPGIATTNRLVAIGSSAGGPETLKYVLTALPRAAPGIAIVQHMGPSFLAQMAERLDRECRIEVKLAERGDAVIPGRALLAPGDRHMKILRKGARYEVDLSDGPPVAGHKPAVDVLFQSVAQAAGANALGVVLTGMGHDGAEGIKAMRAAGASTAAQDEATSIVFGMPARAIDTGAVQDVLPLQGVPKRVLDFGQQATRKAG
ncbi:MAG: chemotaxis protein CheB, partial [Planctomycetota bacterium]